MTNIRAVLNNMTDEELTDLLSRDFTIIDGKLRDCDGVGCLNECRVFEKGHSCPVKVDDFSCRRGVKRFMLEEVKS